MQVKSALKNYLKDHKYTAMSAIPAAAMDADAAAILYDYAVSGDPKALVVGGLLGAAALLMDWIVYEEYRQDLNSISQRKDMEHSEQIIQSLGL